MSSQGFLSSKEEIRRVRDVMADEELRMMPLLALHVDEATTQ